MICAANSKKVAFGIDQMTSSNILWFTFLKELACDWFEFRVFGAKI